MILEPYCKKKPNNFKDLSKLFKKPSAKNEIPVENNQNQNSPQQQRMESSQNNLENSKE